MISIHTWLVVSTPLKNISQMGLFFPIYGKKMFQTTNQQYISIYFIATKSNSSTKQKVDKATAGT